MADNLELQKQLNEIFQERNKILEQAGKLLNDNLDKMKKMVEAATGSSFKDNTEQMQKLYDGAQQASQAFNQMGNASSTTAATIMRGLKDAAAQTKGFTDTIGEAEQSVSKLGFVATSALDGIISGFKFTKAMVGGLLSVGRGLLGFFFNLGKAIITAPFKMLGALLGSVQGGFNELQQEIENVRKEFGNLHEATGRDVITAFKGMQGQLANTGLSVYRVFGNWAERLKYIHEYATNLGPLFGVLGRQFAKNIEYIGAYNKGLGLTAEGQKAVGARAYASGTQMTEILREMANYSIQLGKTFGLSAKEISRDVGNMMADFHTFGHLGVRELTQVSVYARRLGIDIKALGAIMDRWANFEDAATGAAQLSQAFGLNIDAINLMKAQDPAQKVEMLRKAFFAAGRSVEQMTYQERRLLAAQSGVNEESLNLVFSLKNQNLSYAEVQRRGAAAQKRQLSQAEAMQKLAGAIERLVKSGGGGAKSFFEQWLKGFQSGIRWSREFRGLMINLQRDLQITFWQGRRVGRMFVDAFPGVKEFLGGLRDLFDPGRFRRLLTGITESFRVFFNLINSDPRHALPVLLERLKRNFFNWFQSNTPAGHRMIEGFKNFFKALSSITGSLLGEAMKGVTQAVRFIIETITTGGRNLSGLAAGGRGAGGFIAQLVTPIWQALKDEGPALLNAFKDLFTLAFNKLAAWLPSHLKYIAAILFGPAGMGMFGRSVGAIFTANLVRGIGQAVGSGAFIKNIGSVVSGGLERVTGMLRRQSGASAEQMAQATQAIRQTNAAAAEANRSPATPATGNHLKTLGAVLLGMVAFLAAMGGVIWAVRRFHITTEEITKAGLIMGEISILFVAAAGVTAMAAGIGAVAGLGGGLGLVAIGGGLAIITGAIEIMVREGMRVMQVVNSFRADPTFEIKAKAFASIMTAVGSFAASIARIAEATRPGILDFVSGSRGQQDTLRAVNLVVQTLGTQLTGIITAVTNAVNNLTGGVERLKAAEMLGNLLSGVSNLMQVLAPPVQSLQSTSLYDMVVGSSRDIARNVQDYSSSLETIMGSIRIFIMELMNEVTRGSIGLMDTQIRGPAVQRAAEMISSMLGAVGTFAKALMPSGSTVAAISNSRDIGSTTQGIGQTVTAILDAIKGSHIISGIAQLMTIVINSIADADLSDRQIRVLNTVIPIFSSAFNAVGSISSAISGITEHIRGGNQVTAAIYQATSFVSTIMGALQTNLPNIVGAFSANIKGLSGQQAQSVSTTMQSIGQILETVSHIDVQHLPAQEAIAAMIHKVNEISSALNDLNSNTGTVRIAPRLERLGNAIGLGGSGEFTIQNRNFNIQVNVDVHLDAQDLERILVERPGTLITHTARNH